MRTKMRSGKKRTKIKRQTVKNNEINNDNEMDEEIDK